MKQLGFVLVLTAGLVGCGGGGGGGGGGGATTAAAPPPVSTSATTQEQQSTQGANSSNNNGNSGNSGNSGSNGSSGSSGNSGGSSGGTTPINVEPSPSPSAEPSPSTSPSPSPSTSPAPSGGPAPDPANYTASGDTIKIYVSSSTGDDANDGLSEATPKRTVAAGVSMLRDGYPDWLLLKRGDSWSTTFGRWKKSGRSPSEPMIVGSYGNGGARPLIKSGTSTCLNTDNGGGTPQILHSVVFLGLHLWANGRDPDSPDYSGSSSSPTGFRWLRGSHDITIDDCKIESYATNIVIQDYYDDGQVRWTLRRVVSIDSYNNSGHSQGLYMTGVSDSVVEDSIFDHNGWNDAANAEATIYNHNNYIQSDCTGMTFRRNIYSRAASHGIQLRPGGVMENNLSFRNPIGLRMGYGDVDDVKGTMRNNVVLEANDITDSLPRGWGIELIDPDPAGGMTIQGNVVAHLLSTDSPNRRSIMLFDGVNYSGNTVYDYPVPADKPHWGADLEDAGPWVEPNRSIQSFDAQQGGPGTLEHFYAKIRAQERANWDAAYTAPAINDYIRGGFARE